MIRFIDECRERFGVELICRTLRPAVQGFITSRGYRAAKTRVACRPAAARRAAGARGRQAACGELRRLRAAEDACSPETAGVGHRPRPDRAPHAPRGSAWGSQVEEGVHDQAGQGAGPTAGPRPAAVACGRAAPTL